MAEEDEVRDLWNSNAQIWIETTIKGHDYFKAQFFLPEFLKFLGKDLIVGETGGKRILEDTEFPPAQRSPISVLDAGCGAGDLCEILSKMGHQVTGVDISDNLIHYAQSRNGDNKITYRVDSITRLNAITSGTYDVIVSLMVLMDVPSIVETLRTFNRVLKSNGIVYIGIKHPFTTWRSMKYKEGERGVEMDVETTSYFDNHPFRKGVAFTGMVSKPISTIHYPRTISEYINSLIECGFDVLEMEEPRPSDELCKKVEALIPYTIVPFVLFIKAIKKRSLSVGLL